MNYEPIQGNFSFSSNPLKERYSNLSKKAVQAWMSSSASGVVAPPKLHSITLPTHIFPMILGESKPNDAATGPRLQTEEENKDHN